MMRLIDAVEVHAEVQRMICDKRYEQGVEALTDVLKVIHDAPTVDTERKARWVKILENCMNCEQTVSYICTSCGHMVRRPRPLRAYFSLPNFCEHCGANMSDNN